MQRLKSGLMIFFVASLLLAGCGRKEAAPTKPDPVRPATAPVQTAPAQNQPAEQIERPVILAFGDSLTAGHGLLPEESYPAQLQQALDQKGYRYRVVNAGVSGETTAGGLARLAGTLSLHKPQIVILELGPNDGLRVQSLSEMKGNLARMIEMIQQSGAKVILAGMQLPPNYSPEYTTEFKNTYTALAAAYKLPLIPFFLEGVGGQPELNQADAIHPTKAGYTRVVANVLPVLEPLLNRP